MKNDAYIYDPNCLISGAELEAGMTYTNSVRDWATPEDKQAASNGELSVSEILTKGPRKLKVIAQTNADSNQTQV